MPANTRGRRLTRAQQAKQDVYRLVILQSAEKLFAQKGFDDTKVDEIAREAEMAPGTLYSVFPSKAAILAAIREHHEARIFAGAGHRMAKGGSPLDHVAGMVRNGIEYYLENPDYLRILLSSAQDWSATPSEASHVPPWQHSLDLFSTAFQRGIDDGSIRSGRPQVYARAALAVIQSRLIQWLEDGMREEAAEVSREAVEFVIGGVRA